MADIIDHIFDIWRRQSHLDYGESVTTVEHMLQCAVFAERDDAEDTLVAATVLHDIGHLLQGQALQSGPFTADKVDAVE